MAYAYLWGCGNSVKKFIDLDLKKPVQTPDHNDYLALGASLSGRGQAISHITPTQHQVVGFARRALPMVQQS